MRAVDEAALVCDFAEYYHIYDYRSLPPAYAATLACGLRSGSRIMMALADQTVSPEMMLQAMTADAVRFMAWAQTKSAQKNRNRPESVVDQLLRSREKIENNTVAFASGEAFEAAWKGLDNGGRN